MHKPTLIIAPSSHRYNDFQSPNDSKNSARWSLTLKTNIQDVGEVEFTSYFTSFGDKEHSSKQAIQSLKKWMQAMNFALSNLPSDKQGNFGLPINNSPDDVSNALLSDVMEAMNDTNVSKINNELLTKLDNYRYNIYGAVNLIKQLLNPQNPQDNYWYEGAGFTFFSDFKALATYVEQLDESQYKP